MTKCYLCKEDLIVKNCELSKSLSGQKFTTIIKGQVCNSCGEEFYKSEDVRLFELEISYKLFNDVNTKIMTIDGKALKFARKALGLSKEKFSSLFGLDLEILNTWEDGTVVINWQLNNQIANPLTQVLKYELLKRNSKI